MCNDCYDGYYAFEDETKDDPIYDMPSCCAHAEMLRRKADSTRGPVVLDHTGRPVVFVAVYEMSREYGGPEEGGWWYDEGTLQEVRVTSSYLAPLMEKELREKYPITGKRWSVNRRGRDYDFETFDDGRVPPERIPVVPPHWY